MADSNHESEPSETEERQPTPLYACDTCGTTYITDEMDSCPQCDGDVEQTPSFAELGIET
ncbi:hypothetical protein ACLI4Y_02765 [Natrialbaceae archaeon A-CW3]